MGPRTAREFAAAGLVDTDKEFGSSFKISDIEAFNRFDHRGLLMQDRASSFSRKSRLTMRHAIQSPRKGMKKVKYQDPECKVLTGVDQSCPT